MYSDNLIIRLELLNRIGFHGFQKTSISSLEICRKTWWATCPKTDAGGYLQRIILVNGSVQHFHHLAIGSQVLGERKCSTTNETAFRKVLSGQVASSGGGFSNVFLAPPYQLPNVASYKEIEKDHLDEISDHFNSTGRGYPDMAARADDYVIVSNGKWKPISGTSASNPVFASIITLINSDRMHSGKGPVGFINPVLYSNPEILNDVATGANQWCGVDQAFRATRG